MFSGHELHIPDRHGANLARCLLAVLLCAGCMTQLPDQDLRIRQAMPVAKMSPADLWRDYQENRETANARYWGKAVEISGKVTGVEQPGGAAAAVLFAQAEKAGVRANLLDDDAAAILKVATVGQRVTLRCFCSGLNTDVILKSCVLVTP
jgi:tRNA_anti-like